MADRLVFPYMADAPYASVEAPRPIIPIRLSNLGNETSALALLDSGADICALPYHVGLALGARWEDLPESYTLTAIAGQMESKALTLDLQISEWPSMKIMFCWTRDNEMSVILGQTNFFEQVDACFYRSRNQISLDLVPQVTPR